MNVNNNLNSHKQYNVKCIIFTLLKYELLELTKVLLLVQGIFFMEWQKHFLLQCYSVLKSVNILIFENKAEFSISNQYFE